jgi:antitoxin HicB
MSELQKYLEQPYTVLLRRDKDGDYVAKISELPGCSAHGKTSGEALENLEEAKALWIEDCLETGDSVPLPADEEALPSGKWLQRVPRKLHRRLQTLAKNEGVSLNQFVTALLAEAVGERATAQMATQVGQGQLEADVFRRWHEAGWEEMAVVNRGLRACGDWQVVNLTANVVGHTPMQRLVERLAQWSSRLPDNFTFKAEKHEKEKHGSNLAII